MINFHHSLIFVSKAVTYMSVVLFEYLLKRYTSILV